MTSRIYAEIKDVMHQILNSLNIDKAENMYNNACGIYNYAHFV